MNEESLFSSLRGVITAAPVIAVLLYAYFTEKREKYLAWEKRDRAEGRLRAVLRDLAELPREESEEPNSV